MGNIKFKGQYIVEWNNPNSYFNYGLDKELEDMGYSYKPIHKTAAIITIKEIEFEVAKLYKDLKTTLINSN
jgi:hypothetical protein